MRKINTLKKNYEFKYVLSKGKYYYGKFITIYIGGLNNGCKNQINQNGRKESTFLSHRRYRQQKST